MTTKHRPTRAESVDDETRALAAHPRFQELMAEGRRSGPGLELDDSNRRAGITEEEWAAADAEIDRLLAEQAAAESTVVQRANGAVTRHRPSTRRR